MGHIGKRVFVPVAAVMALIVAFTTTAISAQDSASTPSVSDLATRVASLETRVAALEGEGTATATTTGRVVPRLGSSPTKGAKNVTIELVDLAYKPNTFQIPATTAVTVTLKNTGALPHDFNIDQLNVHSAVIQPGQTGTVTIKGAKGTYQYYCNEPGHKAAGMVGTLTITDEIPPITPATEVSTTQPSPATIEIAPFEITVTSTVRTKTAGESIKETARGEYVVVTVSLLNTSNAPVQFFSSGVFRDAKVRDSQGRTYSVDPTASIYATKDLVTDFQPGLTYQVALVFDAPPDASGFTLSLGDREVPLNVEPEAYDRTIAARPGRI